MSSMEMKFQALQGRFVRMEPLKLELKEEVRAAIDCDPESWLVRGVNRMGSGFDAFWSDSCGAPESMVMAYAIRRTSDGRVVGTSSYFTAMAKHGGVEIGETFLHPEARGGAVNPDVKLLMLDHAFESGVVRVEFRVDTRNSRSQAGLMKLGAVREGVLRRNKRTWSGHVSDTAIFSILDCEWPEVRDRLEQRLAGLEKSLKPREF
jgi:N-acetyltransferase